MILVFVFVVRCEMLLCRRMAVRLMASGTAAYNVAHHESAIGFSENIGICAFREASKKTNIAGTCGCTNA
jgi:hypothetical protein